MSLTTSVRITMVDCTVQICEKKQMAGLHSMNMITDKKIQLDQKKSVPYFILFKSLAARSKIVLSLHRRTFVS
jgi:hypothetical protein